MGKSGVRYCLKCDEEFLSPDRIKIRRCKICKKKAYGILEGYPDSEVILSKMEVRDITDKIARTNHDYKISGSDFELECFDIMDSDYYIDPEPLS